MGTQMSADAFSLDLFEESWFELMHWHPDIYGTGNAGAEPRAACALIARQYLTTAMNALRGWSKVSQCWCLFDPSDSEQDSIYVHTENPNRANFPYKFEGVSWDTDPPKWLVATFPATKYVVGSSGQSPELLFWVVERESHHLVNTNLVQR
jgi:hypothetical protein